jgi:lysophospholipase L1-like esterase
MSIKVIACLGSSSTAGKGQAFDWIGALAMRPQNAHFEFRNFGLGGDLAYNALQRAPDVLACFPDKVVVWVGGNDVLAMVFPKVQRFFRIVKRLPRVPSLVWFEESLTALARALRGNSHTEVGLCSLAPIGEDPGSCDPIQSALNRKIADCSAIVAKVARRQGSHYLPLYETMNAELQAAPGQAFTAFNFSTFYADAFRTMVLGRSADDVGRIHGWRFHSDGVHLNSRGGLIAAEIVQRFLDGPAEPCPDSRKFSGK